MAFETPITVREAITRINERKYVLPAIQREFVWKPDQIIRLFDSLITGYPIGSFLFWTVKPENAKKYEFYDFIQHYHERDATHNTKAQLTAPGDVTAVLDGQQRLTALYIGLAGTYAYRKARSRKSNPNAYPRRALYLCLTRRPPEDADASYELAFRDESRDLVKDDDGHQWVRVGAALNWEQPAAPHKFLAQAGLANDTTATDAAWALQAAIHTSGTVSSYLEKDQSLDRVLSIFVRVNSGGTKLSHSDLLLSIATSQWEDLDARETIYDLVDEINRQGRGFAFDKDFVLKSCLMVADLETRFSTANFTAENMKRIELRWGEIDAAIRTTVELLVGFGLSAETLRSMNAVVPIVYYVAQRGAPSGFSMKSTYAAERDDIRRWLLSALLMRAFTGQPDSILRIVRDVLIAHNGAAFPSSEIIDSLDKSQRPMRVTEMDIDRFLDESYGSGYSFSTLGLLYPSFDFRNVFHEDHLHPQAGFTAKRMAAAGVAEAANQQEFAERRDSIANLQLLDGTLNQEKSRKPLQQWLDERFAGKPAERQQFALLHYIPDVDLSFANFLEFTERPRELMRSKLRSQLGMSATPV